MLKVIFVVVADVIVMSKAYWKVDLDAVSRHMLNMRLIRNAADISTYRYIDI